MDNELFPLDIKISTNALGKKVLVFYFDRDDSKKYYDKYGRSPDNKYLCSIGKSSISSESKKYGNNFYKSIFKKKCPICGSTKLYWGIFWAGNETSTSGKFLNKTLYIFIFVCYTLHEG